MKAAFVIGDGEVVVGEAPIPVAGAGEVLVKVAAAGVTPSELVWYPTTHTKDGGPRKEAIPGHEFSGAVEAVGAGVLEFAAGDAVYGMSDWFAQGATAEYCVAAASMVARKPGGLSHAEAASVPIGALTAWQGLFVRAELKAGERVLVTGGAGSVGAFVVQMAHRCGASVVATTSAETMELVRSLGADEVIDYRSGDFGEGKYDVVFDTVGGETLAALWGLGGRVVTIAADSEGSPDARRKEAFFIVEASREQLVNVAGWLEDGSLKTFVGAQVGLDEAGVAYAGRVKKVEGRGKVVVLVG